MIAAVLALALASQAAPAPAVMEAPAPPPSAAAAPAREKLLVLDFRDDGAGANTVRIIQDSLATHLSQDARIDVLSSEDMRRVLDVESQKRALGCDNDESCLAEIAGALGARLLVHGTVGKLGAVFVANVSLYDASQQRSVGRQSVEAVHIEELLPRVRTAGDQLVGKLFGAPAPAVANGGGDVLLWSGVALGAAGLVTGVTGLVISVVNSTTVANAPTFSEKSDAKTTQDTFAVVGVVGAVGAVAGLALVGASFLE